MDIPTLIDGQTGEALDFLATVDQDGILLKARYNNGKKQYNMGLISFDDWQRIQNQINYAACQMANKYTQSRHQSNLTTTTPMNKLATVIAIFNDVQLDVDARNFRKEVVLKHINALNTAFETNIFSSYADPLSGSTWDDLLTPERTSLCSKILNSLLEQKEKLKATH